jgi:tetratricopeptide (TPR) repeat protein
MKRLYPILMLCAFCAGCQSPASHAVQPSPGPASSFEQDARSARLYLTLIGQLIANGRPDAALAHLNAYERLYGGTELATKLKADAEFALRDMSAAQKDYAAIAQGELSAYGHHGLGLVAASANDWTVAARYFAAAAKDDPTNVAFLTDLAEAERRAGHAELSASTFNQVRQLSPDGASGNGPSLLRGAFP